MTENFFFDPAGKRLELLKEAIPKLSRVAFLLDVRRPSSDLKETEAAARLLKVHINLVAVESSEDMENGFRSIVRTRADAFIPDRGGFFVTHQKGLVKLAVKYRLPGMYPEQEFVDAGGLMTYATSISDLYRRAAFYVDKDPERSQACRPAGGAAHKVRADVQSQRPRSRSV